ncbi:MAG: hypothetical protein KY452_12775 [Actinobacteria bacterium]|nr:hypothetical protein [Actinomycetota bacterium]
MRLRVSAGVRLRRLYRDAAYSEEQGWLTIPLPRGADPVGALVTALGELFPPAVAAVAS